MTEKMREAQTLPLLSATDLALDLDRQKRHAKELRNAVRDGCKASIARLERHHPRVHELDFKSLKLTDAQLTVAREAGLRSWPALKKHVSEIEEARLAIETRKAAPDADLPTLHIRCGNDIEAALDRAGFCGDFLKYADPICQGPVGSGENNFELRANFIATEYPGEDFDDTLSVLEEAEKGLSSAGSYARIVLWFEHDPYDQLLLAKILSVLAKTGANERKVELVSFDRFPGIRKFIGIGQLSPAALRHMYGARRPMDSSVFAVANDVVNAQSNPSPLPLFELAKSTEALPYLRGSILRYLAELPSTKNGLSFTEQSILEVVRNGPLSWGEIFRQFMTEIDPLPFHGDLMFLGNILRLHKAGVPALACDDLSLDRAQWGKSKFEITETGLALLDGTRDWKNCRPQERWNGGVRCFDQPDWRWNPMRQRPEALAAQGTNKN